jgi:Tfp pilus assembly protein PilF
LAWALGKLKKWQEAQAALNQALNLNPHCPFSLGLQSWIATQQKEWKTAIKGARQALFKSKQNPTTDVDTLKEWVYPCLLLALDHAVVTKNAKDVDRCLNEYLTELPNNSLAWGFKGWKESASGISQSVLSDFQQATRQGKPPYWILMNLGITQEHRGQISEAIQTYEEAVKRFPNHAFAYLRLGTCLAHSEQWESAIAQLEKSISLDNTLASAHHNLAWSKLNLITSSHQQPNYHQIIKAYQKAIELYNQQSRTDLANQIENAFANVGISLNDI